MGDLGFVTWLGGRRPKQHQQNRLQATVPFFDFAFLAFFLASASRFPIAFRSSSVLFPHRASLSPRATSARSSALVLSHLIRARSAAGEDLLIAQIVRADGKKRKLALDFFRAHGYTLACM